MNAETKSEDVQPDADPADTVKTVFNRGDEALTSDRRAPENESAAAGASVSDVDTPKA